MTVKANVGRKATYVGPSLVALPSGTPVVVVSLTLGAVPLAIVKIPGGHDIAVPLADVSITDEPT
jgi:hypothetical protein